MAYVTCDEVRARLQKSEAELSDLTLNSAAFIPAAEAWFAKYATYSSLDSTDQAIAKAAIIAYVCSRVVNIGAQASSKWGPMGVGELKAGEQNASAKAFKDEAIEFVRELGVEIGEGWFSITGQGQEEYDDSAEDFLYD